MPRANAVKTAEHKIKVLTQVLQRNRGHVDQKVEVELRKWKMILHNLTKGR